MLHRTFLLLLLLLFGAQVSFGQTKRAPVVPYQDTLFYINAGIGSFSADERAESITDKIRRVGKESGFHRDSIALIPSEGGTEIVFRDIIIMCVTSTDAQPTRKNQLTLASEYRQIIGSAIDEHNRKTGWLYILFRVLLVILIVGAQYFLIKFVAKLFRKIAQKVRQQKGKRIKSLKIKTFNLMDENKATKFILSVVKMLWYATVVLMLYLSLPLIFSVFPPTRGIADKLFGYVLHPVQKIFWNIIGYIPDLITIVVIVVVFRYLIKGLHYLAEEIDKGRLTLKGFYPDWAHPTFNIIRTLLYAFMFVVIFPYLPGSDSDVFKGVSVFLGIIFSIGSSSVIGNVVSGLVLTYMRPFKVGDRIKIGELVGNVIERTPFVTRIRTPKNEEVTVPNSSILSAQSFNYSHSAQAYGLILHTEVSFGYDTSWRLVHQLLLEAAARTTGVMDEPRPFILQTALDDFYAKYQINVYVENADQTPAIYSELNQHIQDVFSEAGIKMMAPHYYSQADVNTK